MQLYEVKQRLKESKRTLRCNEVGVILGISIVALTTAVMAGIPR
jgi:hypothetical protein